MANLIEDTEGLAGIGVMLLVLATIAVLIYTFRDFFGLSKSSNLADVKGKVQSLKNAAEGFPDGADPGTVPAAQVAQGVIESARNFGDYVSSPDGGEETTILPPASGSYGAQIDEYNEPAAVALRDMSGIDPTEVDSGEFGGSVNPAPIVTGIENWIQNNRVF